jgi:hypothetical protein
MNNHIPDPKWHKYISFVKSGLRISAGILLIQMSVASAGLLFIIAEILGIAEEMV